MSKTPELTDEKRMDLLGDGEVVANLNGRSWVVRLAKNDGLNGDNWIVSDSLRDAIDKAVAAG